LVEKQTPHSGYPLITTCSALWLSAHVFGFGKTVPQSSNGAMYKTPRWCSISLVSNGLSFGKGLAILMRQRLLTHVRSGCAKTNSVWTGTRAKGAVAE
jgi:hypothetical protein